MKKLVVILLLVLYAGTSSGMTLHLHYCCGRLDKVDLVPVKKDGRCAKKHDNAKAPCCDDQQLELTIKSDYKNTEAAKVAFKAVPLASPPILFLATRPGEGKRLAPHLFAPPPRDPAPLFVLHCVYRI